VTVGVVRNPSSEEVISEAPADCGAGDYPLHGGLVIFLWFELGPYNPLYGLLVAAWTLNLGLVSAPLVLRLPAWLFRVPPGEHRLYRLLGVGAFGGLLDRSGWNRHVALPARGLHVARASLPRLYLSMRAAAGAHGIGFAVHLLLAMVAVFTRHPSGALWLLVPGVFVHLYPVLLQRSVLLRLQPMLGDFRAVERSP
jgi:hypothetical protein